MPQLSIIVPIYNAEKYLSRCIDSILAQSFNDFELILIDDGSKDSSGSICDTYSAKDSRVIIFHKNNGGVSSARNLGLDNAKGDYVTFVDADDWLEPNTITDVTFVGGYDVIRIPCNHCSTGKTYKNDVFCESNKSVYRLLLTDFCNACWGRLYKRDIIANARFVPNIRMGEDILFFVDIVPNIHSLHIISGTNGYHYCKNDSSAQHTLGVMTDMDLLIENLLKRQLPSKLLVWQIIRTTCYYNCINNDSIDFFYRRLNFFDIFYAPMNSKTKLIFFKHKIKSIINHIRN